ncbi:MAG: type IV pilin protein [Cocleimonas sp.]
MNKNIQQGFTLIEVMIVVAILGIISAIAIPSYSEYVRKGKRTDAKVELLKLAQLQESYFVQNLSYAKDLTTGAGGLGLGAAVKSEQGEYTMSISSLTPSACTGIAGGIACTEFTLTATANGSQANDKCKNFTLTNTGVKGRSGTGETVQKCWR